jgi:RNA polymerase sigma factor (sigma-70 family)
MQWKFALFEIQAGGDMGEEDASSKTFAELWMPEGRTSMASFNGEEPHSPVVFVVDGDASVRHTLSRLISSIGLPVRVFASAKDFLRLRRPNVASCLILEIRLPDISGLKLQSRLADTNIQIPIVFITAHGDVSMCVRAMKAGAVDFLTKPYRDQDVLDAIHTGLDRDRARREQQAKVAALRHRFESLTRRESHVVKMVVSGMPNKGIAAQFGVSENTVKVQRSRAMKKLQTRSVPELVSMIGQIDTQCGPRDTGHSLLVESRGRREEWEQSRLEPQP